MTIHPKPSPSSQRVGNQLHWPKALGPLDEIPDEMNFQTLLRLIHDHLKLDYDIVRAPSYVRVRRRGDPIDQPGIITYPLMAIEAGTAIDSEPIKGMLEQFNLTEQDFREAYNAVYGLKVNDDPEVPAKPQPPKV